MSDTQLQWTMVGILIAAIVVIIGFLTPIIRYTKNSAESTTKLVDKLDENIEETKSNSKKIEELEKFQHNSEILHDRDKNRLDDHEKRITKLEEHEH